MSKNAYFVNILPTAGIVLEIPVSVIGIFRYEKRGISDIGNIGYIGAANQSNNGRPTLRCSFQHTNDRERMKMIPENVTKEQSRDLFYQFIPSLHNSDTLLYILTTVTCSNLSSQPSANSC